MALLTRFGVELTELPTEALHPPHLVVQVSSQSGVRSFYSSISSVAVPGPDWLQGHADAVWVTSKLMPVVTGNTIASDTWNQHPQGARIVEVTSELNGPVENLKKRLATLIDAQMPELASLIANDQAVSISYSDRYLKSPWSLMLLTSFLELFRSKTLQSLSLHTLAPSGSQPSFLLSHDWMRADDQEAILELWLKSQFDLLPDINVMNSPRDLLHSRVITVNWASGKTSKILLDQGMGYWRAQMPYRDQMHFDFNASPDKQALQMLDKFSCALMHQSGDWPTYISCSIS